MIHGGIKYSLAGATTGASESIADMPSRWRSCPEGYRQRQSGGGRGPERGLLYVFRCPPRLKTDRVLWQQGHSKAAVSSVPETPTTRKFSSHRRLKDGSLYQLKDLVLDTRSLDDPFTPSAQRLHVFEGNVTASSTPRWAGYAAPPGWWAYRQCRYLCPCRRQGERRPHQRSGAGRCQCSYGHCTRLLLEEIAIA